MNNLGPCKKCGQGGFSLPKIDYKPLILISKSMKDNYCTDCGRRLSRTCNVCHGSGKKSDYYFSNRDRYCSECGSKLENNDECTSCDGTGEIYDSEHWKFCHRRFY